MNKTGLTLAPLFLVSGLAPGLGNAGSVLPLPEPDRQVLEKSLGKGVVGSAVPAPAIDNSAGYFKLAPGDKAFQIVHGPRMGHKEQFRLMAEPPNSGRPGWQYQIGEEQAGFLKTLPDGSFVLTGVHEFRDGAITRYDPPEPFLLKGLAPGTERKLRMSVRVYDADQPDEVKHEGVLAMTFRYMGAYRIAVPAGTYEAVLMKSTFSGHVGPAELEDTQYRFFAPEAGLVAMTEHRHVSAFLLYRTDMNIARVLAGPAR